jgi:hypothetical protein
VIQDGIQPHSSRDELSLRGGRLIDTSRYWWKICSPEAVQVLSRGEP